MFEDEEIYPQTFCQIVLPPTFFSDLVQLEKQYLTKRDTQTMSLLLCYYTDCVSYFSYKQEKVSEYFQTKIQQLSKEIVIVGSPLKAEENRVKMNKKVMSFMAEENITSQISKQIEKEKKMAKKVNDILEEQEERLKQRRKKSKRVLNKSQSVSFSYGSLNTSPDMERREALGILSSKFLFQKAIHSSDDEQCVNSN